MRYIFWTVLTGLFLGAIGASAEARAESVEYFPNLCVELRSGAHLVDIESSLLVRGYSDWDAGAFLGRTVKEHCPDQINNVLAQIR